VNHFQPGRHLPHAIDPSLAFFDQHLLNQISSTIHKRFSAIRVNKRSTLWVRGLKLSCSMGKDSLSKALAIVWDFRPENGPLTGSKK
jgi:hypothetical protein